MTIKEAIAVGARRNSGGYRAVFFAHNGPGPYSCFFCKEEVTLLKVFVHHIDENHFNDDPSNLTAVHGPCHTAHHMSELHRGVPKTQAHKAAIARAKTGTRHSPETIEKLKVAAQNRKKQSAESREIAASKVRGIKRSPETRERMRRAALARWARVRETGQ